MSSQLRMFEAPKKAKPRITRAHVKDCGTAAGNDWMATFECKRCGTVIEWLCVKTVDIRRGVPCPTCCPTEWQKWHG